MSASETIRQRRSKILREEALRLGFDFVGIAKAEYMDQEARRLESWLERGLHGRMGYMANHFELRVDPTQLVPGAKTVVCLAYNYFTEQTQTDPTAPKLSRYAYGEDYHHVIKDKLNALLAFLRDQIGDINGRCFVDSAPLLERDWGRRSGLGWVGKNTLLIHPRKGSWMFLAELVIDLELHPDGAMKDYCGTCTRCIDACPTDAIKDSGYELDASKCISYFTIELRDSLPEDMRGKFENWMFGCDICQEVCPWNRFATKHQEPAFEPHPDLLTMSRNDWIELTEETFRTIFRKSAVKRTKYEGLKRNIRFLTPDE